MRKRKRKRRVRRRKIMSAKVTMEKVFVLLEKKLFLKMNNSFFHEKKIVKQMKTMA